MPANPTVLSDVEDILIEDVHPRIESQVFKKNITLEHFEKGKGMTPMQNNTFLIKVEAYEHKVKSLSARIMRTLARIKLNPTICWKPA